jgi:hypothetical protein
MTGGLRPNKDRTKKVRNTWSRKIIFAKGNEVMERY